MLDAKKVDVMETPIELPRLRTRLRKDEASVRSVGGKVENDTRFIGTNTIPIPIPWTKVVMPRCHDVISGVHPDISRNDHNINNVPATISTRGSTRLAIRPTVTIVINVPNPRGAIRRPV